MPRTSLAILLALLATGCSKKAGVDAASDAGTASADASPPVVASAAATTAATAGGFALPGIPLATPPRPGPIRVDGMPRKVEGGNSDPTTPFGFTRDGSKLVYCQFDVCCAENVSFCTEVDGSGKETAVRNEGKPPTKQELQAFAKTEQLIDLHPNKDMTYDLPPPTGTWAYGGDITLVVKAVAPTEDKKTGEVTVPGNVKIGGRLEGEKEVFVLFPPKPKFCAEVPAACMDAQLNGLFLSPKGDELGAVVFIRNPSHGSTFAPVRLPVTKLAARVFNDTATAHHQKKEWAKSAELFTRAVYADPSEEKFAFNLACALARQNDPRAEHALRHAVARGGDAVRARARKDEDFASVRTAPWFEAALTH